MIQCATPWCDTPLSVAERRRIPANQTGLCPHCFKLMERRGLPIAGFIPADTLTVIARRYLTELGLPKTDAAEAERYARGARYRRGPWSQRPPYNMYKLNGGRARERVLELILGKEHAPNALAIVKAFIHYRLSQDILGTRHRYGLLLAGMTFMGRQGTQWPKERKGEVRTGSGVHGHKSAVYLLKPRDFLILGTHALRSAERLGLKRHDKVQATDILRLFHEATTEGPNQPVVHYPKYAMRTKRGGDHPCRHWIGPEANVPARYRMKYRGADGKINGTWPVGIEPTKQKQTITEPTPEPTAQLPDTSAWLFAGFTQHKEENEMATGVTLGADGEFHDRPMIKNSHGGVVSSTDYNPTGVEVRKGGLGHKDHIHDASELKNTDRVVYQGMEIQVAQARSMGVLDELFPTATPKANQTEPKVEPEVTDKSPKSNTGNSQYDQAVDSLNEHLDAGTMTMEEAQPYDVANGQLAMAGVTPEEAWSTLHGLAEGTISESDVDANTRQSIEAARKHVETAATQSALDELGAEGMGELGKLADMHPGVQQVLWQYSIDRAQGQHGGVSWTELLGDLKKQLSL